MRVRACEYESLASSCGVGTDCWIRNACASCLSARDWVRCLGSASSITSASAVLAMSSIATLMTSGGRMTSGGAATAGGMLVRTGLAAYHARFARWRHQRMNAYCRRQTNERRITVNVSASRRP